MNQLAVQIPAFSVPALIAAAGPRAGARFVEFFAAQIRNPNTRRAYVRAVISFLDWCHEHGMESVIDVEPLHVAAWLELQTKAGQSAPSVKQRLAALRHLFDWLVIGQIMPTNPANSVRGPRHSVRTGKTSVLEAVEARTLLDSIDIMCQSARKFDPRSASNIDPSFQARMIP